MAIDIQIKNLSFEYDFFGGKSGNVLTDISLNIQSGEFVALVGPSGSGKTTFMQQLTGLLKPTQGEVLIDGKNIWEKKTGFTEIRRRIGLVFQFPESQLFEETVLDDVAFGARNLGLPESEVLQRVREAIELVDLDFDAFKNRTPFNLSEGEKRRVAIAGILAMQPEFLALDEPTAGLDFSGVAAVINILKNLHEKGKSILLITHDLNLVSALVDRIVLIHHGKIHFDGHKRELFQSDEILKSIGLPSSRIQKFVSFLKARNWINREDLYSVEDIKNELENRVLKNKPVVEK